MIKAYKMISDTQVKSHFLLPHFLLKTAALGVAAIVLVGCQATPNNTPALTTVITTRPAEKITPAPVESEAKRTALPEYAEPSITSKKLPSKITPPRVVQPKVTLRDGTNIPAFGMLIDKAQQQIQANQLDAAEQTLIQAQRMAPQSATVYAYLSEVAIKKRQGSNAEAMARKGLMLSNSPKQQHAFWQLIALSAELQNNAALSGQAKTQMQRLASQF